MKKIVFSFIAMFLCLALTACSSSPKENKEAQKKELLIYCGITMVKPIKELADRFEKTHNCKVTITQGGSKDLYESLKTSKQGDLYFPGSLSYRENNIADGLLKDGVYLGYNVAAIVVKKGNPKNISSSLDNFTNKNLSVVLCNPDTGSIGNETKKVLESYGNYEAAIKNAVLLTTDSRNLTKAIKDGQADVVLNWRATTFWEDNKEITEAIAIDEKYAKKATLVLNLLSFSQNQDLAKEFMNFASSKDGKTVFYEFGFLNKDEIDAPRKEYK
ncbi:MAG: hypothetical protein RL154_121 [Pseudomonadota bacterium]|jgi:molybdate transport system substrate-binding protein